MDFTLVKVVEVVHAETMQQYIQISRTWSHINDKTHNESISLEAILDIRTIWISFEDSVDGFRVGSFRNC